MAFAKQMTDEAAPTSQLQSGAVHPAGGLGGAGQALLGQQVFHHGDVGGDVQGLVAEQGVQLLVEGGAQGVQHGLHLLVVGRK